MSAAEVSGTAWRLTAILVVATVTSCRDVAERFEWVSSLCAPEGSGKCDGSTFYRCKDHHLVPSAVCGGDNGCYKAGNTVKCDESRGNVGDACGSGGGSCSLDGKTALTCRGGKLVVEATCDGPTGCTVAGGTRTCDGGHARVGAPCTGATGACADDGRSMLLCKEDVFAKTNDCLGPRGCHPGEDNKVHCDMSIALEGGSCTSGHACSVDGASRLSCKDGGWVVDRPCLGPRGCVVDADAGTVWCDPSRRSEPHE